MCVCVCKFIYIYIYCIAPIQRLKELYTKQHMAIYNDIILKYTN